MRTVFLHGEVDQYVEVKDALVEGFVAACAEPGDGSAELIELLLADKLAVDGLLARWCESDVERFLGEVVPRRLVVDDLSLPPRMLHRWIDFLAELDLLMPGDEPPALHAAIDRATPAYRAAMAEPAEWGLTKFFTVAMHEQGVHPEDDDAVADFFVELESGAAGIDRSLVAGIEERDTPETLGAPAYWLPPMVVPEAGTPELDAPHSLVLSMVRALHEWVGDGRDIDVGRLSESDVDELAGVLADAGGPVDAFTVRLLVEWCKRANLIRMPGKRLVRTQVSAPVVAEPDLLWMRLWRSFVLLEDAFGVEAAAVELLTGGGDAFVGLVREALCGLYSRTEALPLEHLVDSIVGSLRARSVSAEGAPGSAVERADGPARSTAPEAAGAAPGAVGIREAVRRLLQRVLDQWELMGAVRRYTTTWNELVAEIDATVPAGVRADHAVIELTPLGVWAARESLQGFGLLAPSVQDVVRYPVEVLVLALPTSPPDVVEEVIGAWIADRGGAEASSAEVAGLLRRVDDPAVRLTALWLLEHTGPAGVEAVSGLRADPLAGPAARMWLQARPIAEPVALEAGDELLFAIDEMALTAVDDPALFLSEFRQRSTPNQIAVVEELPRSHHGRAGVVLRAIVRLHPDERVVAAARRSLERLGDSRASA